MLPKFLALITVFSCVWVPTSAFIKVGLIYKKGDEITPSIVEHFFGPQRRSDVREIFQLVKEEAEDEDARSYHRAFCRLLASEIDAFISPADSPYYSVLSDYANEYQIPFITSELPQAVSLASNNYSFGICPITTRAMLEVFRVYGWNGIVYLYDHDDGPENLSFMFTVASRVLNLTVAGMFKVTSAEEANMYLARLDKSLKNKSFHVVLDTDPGMAHEIIRRHVNDIHVRKTNFHFALSKPISEDFWNSQMVTFGAVNVTAFIIKNQLPSPEISLLQSKTESGEAFNISYHYYYDAAMMLNEAVKRLMRWRLPNGVQTHRPEPAWNCHEDIPSPRPKGAKLSSIIKDIKIQASTGRIEFENGQRKNFDLNITEVTPNGIHRIGRWSNGNLYSNSLSERKPPTALPLIQTNGRMQIVTKIRPPYMMLKTGDNSTAFHGNDRFEGYCKDMIDLLAEDMNFTYDIHVVEDGMYGEYEKVEGSWSGIIGDLIQGKADLAVADLRITGQRQRVVEFTDPFELVGFNLVMKHPRSVSKLSSTLFFLSAFTTGVWICVLFAVILFCVLFHFITKFTGAPDSIESASGIWGRKHTAVVNLWFIIGTSMLQGTGVYPRSISSRILSGFCWFFTLIFSSLFIASITVQILTVRQTDENSPQLSQIKALSMESIIMESVSRGWPKIGLIEDSNTALFMKRSNLPIYKEFARYLENHPDVVVSSEEEGIKKVRESNGNYMVLLESLTSEYAIGRKPCDIIATHDSVHYAGYGLATPLGSTLITEINKALHKIQEKGALGHLHRKWWIDSSECKNFVDVEKIEGTTQVFSGLLCVSAVGFLILLGVFAIQYLRQNQTKESRRQQLSFEDMNLGQSLPTPPPELLAEPAPVLNLPEYDKRTLL